VRRFSSRKNVNSCELLFWKVSLLSKDFLNIPAQIELQIQCRVPRELKIPVSQKAILPVGLPNLGKQASQCLLTRAPTRIPCLLSQPVEGYS